jgi:hypothetical protein
VALLKGILLQARAPLAVRERPFLDVDLLVDPVRLGPAVEALRSAGFAEVARTAAAVTLKEQGHDISIDLHFSLFPPWLFRLRASEVLARASLDAAAFGVPFLLPSGLDFYAHLVGHFAKGRHTRRDVGRLNDFAIVADVHALEPRRCADHLRMSGLARAAEYTLQEVLAERADPFAEAVLRRLPRDPLRVPLVAATRRLLSTPGRAAPLVPLAPYLVASSLPMGAAGATSHAARAALRFLLGTDTRS